jgi:RNA polymerase sigma-70 factor (ECF subfamily)
MSAEKPNAPLGADVQHFATTQWSVVLAAGDRQRDDAQRALTKLCEVYWYPLYAYVRRRVESVDDAHDLTQAFFEHLLEKNYLAVADPQRGRFRAFLITAFKHFLSKEWEKAKAQKRGRGRSPISLDFSTGDSQITLQPAGGLTAEQMYERQWAITLLGRVMQRLERELEKVGKRSQFGRLKDFIISTKDDTTYADVASELGMTESAARMATSRLRRRYRQLLREEIAQTVSSTEDIDDEINNLFQTFAK